MIMRNVITLLILSISFFVQAQVVNITYVTVPRENSETFLKLHEKFTNLSNSKDRLQIDSAIFAHAFAGDYTFAIYDFYANAEDLVNDASLIDEAMNKNIDAMNLDKEKEMELNEEYKSYSSMYAYNHTDQIRQDKGLEGLEFESENLDWSTKKVVVVSKYEVKWGMNKIFYDGLIDGIKSLKESGHAVGHYASRHLYGSGADYHTYQFYESWTDFAAYEEANSGQSMSDDNKKFWSSIESHDDEILTFIGGTNPETKVFSYRK